MIATKRLVATATAVMCAAIMPACSNGPAEAAQAAYDECHNEDAEIQLLRHDGDTVYIEVTGEAARSYAGVDDEIDNLGNSSQGDMAGIGVLAGVMLGLQCIVDATNYPGSYEQLEDGDEWDGWQFTENYGAGSEMAFTFTATH